MFHGFVNDCAHLFSTRGLYQDLNAMFVAQAGEWRRRRAEDATRMIAIGCQQETAQLLRRASRARRILVSYQQQGQRYKRRVAMIASMTNFFVIEAAIVLRSRMTQRVMVRMISLD